MDIQQEDRELVAQYLERDGGWTTGYVKNIRNGHYDKNDMVQVACLARIAAKEIGRTEARPLI